MAHQIPTSERQHIAFLGRCNSGKSSLINCICRQQVSIVSDISGTTTDPVIKAVELPNLGAVVLIDTPGLDDISSLGQQRIDRTFKILNKADIAVVLFSDNNIETDAHLYTQIKSKGIPTIPAISKGDCIDNIKQLSQSVANLTHSSPIIVSAKTGDGIDDLIKSLSAFANNDSRLITQGLCNDGDTVLLVMPQDAQAPKGRLIKPQVETLRELLDRGCNVMCCTPQNLEQTLSQLVNPPQLIITDSQVFSSVHHLKPEKSLLTSFSVLFARYKGDIDTFIAGAQHLLSLNNSAHILIAEACSHIPQNEDIGRVKLPRLLRKHLGNEIKIDIVGGNDFPEDLSHYDLIIHCGACMFNRQHVISRIAQAQKQNVPITNYGIAIAALTGILPAISY